ncbi:hypothetical protein K437DRAFT_24757 [Tilletiaria anomala UBC 951]|uniref:PAS domain-containing protein n=1 Tax=Tilletiaria anomala (strain ATCC 24038 / CBS 436.72 / UBC 951) TaxID=1037660 RepID=A0A066WMJ5_TILAU|nr:uncharacterized protein K437DRAFT_24757 [Tilletiaria anomala UBC 951]KDN52229.1 hypothetical protein K437DRAFT_24757 [Tilletiaria anomala UBC 951]
MKSSMDPLDQRNNAELQAMIQEYGAAQAAQSAKRLSSSSTNMTGIVGALTGAPRGGEGCSMGSGNVPSSNRSSFDKPHVPIGAQGVPGQGGAQMTLSGSRDTTGGVSAVAATATEAYGGPIGFSMQQRLSGSGINEGVQAAMQRQGVGANGGMGSGNAVANWLQQMQHQQRQQLHEQQLQYQLQLQQQQRHFEEQQRQLQQRHNQKQQHQQQEQAGSDVFGSTSSSGAGLSRQYPFSANATPSTTLAGPMPAMISQAPGPMGPMKIQQASASSAPIMQQSHSIDPQEMQAILSRTPKQSRRRMTVGTDFRPQVDQGSSSNDTTSAAAAANRRVLVDSPIRQFHKQNQPAGGHPYQTPRSSVPMVPNNSGRSNDGVVTGSDGGVSMRERMSSRNGGGSGPVPGHGNGIGPGPDGSPIRSQSLSERLQQSGFVSFSDMAAVANNYAMQQKQQPYQQQQAHQQQQAEQQAQAQAQQQQQRASWSSTAAGPSRGGEMMDFSMSSRSISSQSFGPGIPVTKDEPRRISLDAWTQEDTQEARHMQHQRSKSNLLPMGGSSDMSASNSHPGFMLDASGYIQPGMSSGNPDSSSSGGSASQAIQSSLIGGGTAKGSTFLSHPILPPSALGGHAASHPPGLGSKILRGADANTPSGTSTATDLTKRKGWSSRMVDELLDFVHVLDPQSNILFASPSIVDMTGWRAEELKGKKLTDFVHPDDISLVQRNLSASLESAKPEIHMYFRFMKKRINNSGKPSRSPSDAAGDVSSGDSGPGNVGQGRFNSQGSDEGDG